MENNKKFLDKIAIAKGLGASGHGSGHWLGQRFSALILLLLSICIIANLIKISSMDLGEIIEFLKKPSIVSLLIIFSGTAFYHSSLGMQVVIEDYVKCRILRVLSIFLVKFVAFATLISLIVSLIYLMVV